MLHPEDWRWRPSWHDEPTTATIQVSSPTDEQDAERERKIKAGAEVVPFGFGREVPRAEPPEDDYWPGQGL